MTTDGVAVVAMTVTSLAQTGTLLWLGLRAVDRARLVSPPRQQDQQQAADKAAAPLRSAM